MLSNEQKFVSSYFVVEMMRERERERERIEEDMRNIKKCAIHLLLWFMIGKNYIYNIIPLTFTDNNIKNVSSFLHIE
jgi:hypothetical protein